MQSASQASVGRVIAEVRKVHGQAWPVFKA
jgi:hypothetical protein